VTAPTQRPASAPFNQPPLTAARLGPAFVHGHCMRAYSHSLSDDDRHYRTQSERESDALRDPLVKMRAACSARASLLKKS